MTHAFGSGLPRSVSGSLAERKRAATRQRIAAAAAQLVASVGLAAATADRIADAAHIGRATFFRYFNSKEVFGPPLSIDVMQLEISSKF